MGKGKRLEELETLLAASQRWEKHWRDLAQETREYLETLAQMPEDAVLLYTLSGVRTSHAIGKSARVLLSKFAGKPS